MENICFACGHKYIGDKACPNCGYQHSLPQTCPNLSFGVCEKTKKFCKHGKEAYMMCDLLFD